MKPRYVCFVIFFIWISFFPQPVQNQYSIATKIFFIALFLLSLVKKKKSLFKKEDFALLLFVAAIGINVFFAKQKIVAFLTYIDLVLPLIAIYYFISENFSSENSFLFLAKVISIVSLVVALGGILECIFKYNFIYQHLVANPYYERFINGFTRPMSTLLNPAPLGSYLVGTFPFSFILFKRHQANWRLIGAIGIVLSITTIILTFSRGAFLGLIFMAIFYLFVQRKYKAIIVLVGIVVGVIFMASFLPYPYCKLSVGGLIGSDVSSLLSHYRLDRFGMALKMLKEHPFFGVGFQHFRLNLLDYFSSYSKMVYEFMIADNMYLTLLAETGIVGFLGFLIFLTCLFKKGWKGLREFELNHADQKKWILLVSLMSLSGLLVTMCGYEFMYWTNPYLLFCIIIGCFNAACLSA